MCSKVVLILVFSFCFIAKISSIKTDRSVPVIDILISRIKDDVWTETLCLQNTLEILHGVKNGTLWATWVWDSMQSPTGVFYGSNYQLGNFDQCVNAPSPWTGEAMQYCLVDLDIGLDDSFKEYNFYDNAGDYLKTITKYGRENSQLIFGVCLPTSCSTSSVTKIFRHIHNLSYIPDGQIRIDARNCQNSIRPVKYNDSTYRFWLFMKILLISVLFSTFYNTLVTNKNNTLESITKPFCLQRNYNELFKSTNEDIKSMNGIRFMTALLIISIHEYSFLAIIPISNGQDLDMFHETPLAHFMKHTEVAVDTFFAMSGLLLAKGLVSKKRNLIIVLFKRYLRLLGPYATALLFSMIVLPHIGTGPVYSEFIRKMDGGICQNYWWQNLLMLNNNIENVCYPVSWYVLSDYRLAVLGTFLSYIYQKNKNVGIISFITVFGVMLFKLGYTVYANRLPVIPIQRVTQLIKMRELPFINEVYFNFQSRVGPYFVGIIMGYIIGLYKPKDYRNIINKRWSLILTAFALITMLLVNGLYTFYANKVYNGVEFAIVAALNRTAWAVAVCCIIGCCEFGCVPLLNNFLGHSFFTPLSKLSYCMYLTHMFVLARNLFTTRNLLKHDMFTSIINTFGNTVMSCIISLIVYLLIEGPLIYISNRIFKEKPISVKASNGSAINGLANGNCNSPVITNGDTKLKTI